MNLFNFLVQNTIYSLKKRFCSEILIFFRLMLLKIIATGKALSVYTGFKIVG